MERVSKEGGQIPRISLFVFFSSLWTQIRDSTGKSVGMKYEDLGCTQKHLFDSFYRILKGFPIYMKTKMRKWRNPDTNATLSF